MVFHARKQWILPANNNYYVCWHGIFPLNGICLPFSRQSHLRCSNNNQIKDNPEPKLKTETRLKCSAQSYEIYLCDTLYYVAYICVSLHCVVYGIQMIIYGGCDTPCKYIFPFWSKIKMFLRLFWLRNIWMNTCVFPCIAENIQMKLFKMRMWFKIAPKAVSKSFKLFYSSISHWFTEYF